jgi:nucleotide-binding universal stress UspA family protein
MFQPGLPETQAKMGRVVQVECPTAMSQTYQILVCTDRSPDSLVALDCASRLAGVTAARVTLCHVADPAEPQDAARAERELREIVRDRTDPVSPVVLRPDAGESVEARIVRYAAELQAGTIALRGTDVTMLGHLFRHSTSMEVASATPIPVMVAGPAVRPPAAGDGYHVVITTDGSAASTGVLASIGPLLTLPGVRATILRLHEPRLGDRGRAVEMASSDEQLAGLSPHLPQDVRVDCVLAEVDGLESIPHAIIRLAADLDADAIAMASRGQTRAHHVLVGSVTLAVVKHAPVPVIIAHS